MSVGYSGVLEKEIMKLISKEGFQRRGRAVLTLFLFSFKVSHSISILTHTKGSPARDCSFVMTNGQEYT